MTEVTTEEQIEVDPFQGIIDYIETHGKMYREQNIWGDLPKEAPIRVADIYDWFLKNAVPLTGMDVELADAEMKLTRFFKPEIKQCYYNSMMAHPSLEYWEGWATSMIPLNHAWNVKDGKVVDTTWSLLDHQREKAEHILYFGIKIPREFIVSQLRNDTHFRQASHAGPFLWDYAIKCIIEEKKQDIETCESYFSPKGGEE